VSHLPESTYGADFVVGAAAAAEVAWVRMALGPLLTAAIPVGKGEFDIYRVVDFEACLQVRATCLAGGDRSILTGGSKEWRVKRKKGRAEGRAEGEKPSG
jgi:hypothetical protein